MAQDQLAGNWKQIAGKLKSQWGKITDDDLKEADGSRTKIIGLLQEKYGYVKQKAEEELELFLNNPEEGLEKIKKNVKEYSNNVEEYIQEHPYKSMLISTGMGLIIGSFIFK